ncbi:hypothetical protein CC85DRAFT_303404 [Cutaneotrichosporon oleaginosum]|uniref:Uncharacterized protein n=1 Tax=Cutaneotrichosporon oleaginosum TaxID=879819 RepID=A0A0J0XJD7_9TREE|nr:uncharacterized protein CC85DRAFT_303404 [Cutaneotrichosporon oleaginosum]KLT41207.1 hypothetical protein CC85DRAFT_303404 [Cutaneotrichosporon oleaginosum]TXT05473.1 hypothetical protein COLE_06793 [Cutaneotrichosporon oleaginosum]
MRSATGRSARRRANVDPSSDIEDRDANSSFLQARRRRSYPENRQPDDAFSADSRANTTFPRDPHMTASDARRGPRDSRATARRNDNDTNLIWPRSQSQLGPASKRHRGVHRQSYTSVEDGDPVLDRDQHLEPLPKGAHPSPNDPQALHAILQRYIKSLPESQRKAFYEEIAPSPNEVGPASQAQDVSLRLSGVTKPEIIGLLPPPSDPLTDASENSDAEAIDFEQIDDVLKQLTSVTWRDSEVLRYETLVKIATSAQLRAVELKEKAFTELDKIDAAEKEKLRLIEVAREDFEKILSEQRDEIALKAITFEEKTKALRKKAEKLLTPGEIAAQALAEVMDRRSSNVKGPGT